MARIIAVAIAASVLVAAMSFRTVAGAHPLFIETAAVAAAATG